MMARSTTFCSSRTLPGHEAFAKSSIARGEIGLIFFPICGDSLDTK
jgi:hypothetical protein